MMLTTATKRGDGYVIRGRKWFITGAADAAHFILVARTSDDPRRGLTAFLHHRDDPGWRIDRRIPIMGPEEHGGHCELVYEDMELPAGRVILGEGLGLKITQMRVGPARPDPLHAHGLVWPSTEPDRAAIRAEPHGSSACGCRTAKASRSSWAIWRWGSRWAACW